MDLKTRWRYGRQMAKYLLDLLVFAAGNDTGAYQGLQRIAQPTRTSLTGNLRRFCRLDAPHDRHPACAKATDTSTTISTTNYWDTKLPHYPHLS